MLDITIDWLDDDGNVVDRTKIEYNRRDGRCEVQGSVFGSQFRLHVEPTER